MALLFIPPNKRGGEVGEGTCRSPGSHFFLLPVAMSGGGGGASSAPPHPRPHAPPHPPPHPQPHSSPPPPTSYVEPHHRRPHPQGVLDLCTIHEIDLSNFAVFKYLLGWARIYQFLSAPFLDEYSLLETLGPNTSADKGCLK